MKTKKEIRKQLIAMIKESLKHMNKGKLHHQYYDGYIDGVIYSMMVNEIITFNSYLRLEKYIISKTEKSYNNLLS